jgi:hypothetical protein
MDAFTQAQGDGIDDRARKIVFALLDPAGPRGMTDRDVLLEVRKLPGLEHAKKDTFSPARTQLFAEFAVIPTGTKRPQRSLETGEPTNRDAIVWCLTKYATDRQVMAAAAVWRKRFPFSVHEFDRARSQIADCRRRGQLYVTVAPDFLERLLNWSTAGVAPSNFDPRALAAGDGRDEDDDREFPQEP